MIFLAVGTIYPFDRLVRGVDQAIGVCGLSERIFGQIGESSYTPVNFDYERFIDKDSFDMNIRRATAIIAHAGMGVITAAIDNNKPLLVMPRLQRYGEVVNDHQSAIAAKFEKAGHLLAAYDAKELAEKIEQLNSFRLCPRHVQADLVAERIKEKLCEF